MPCRVDRRQKAEVGARRPDRLDPCELVPEPRGDLGQGRLERRVGRDLAALRGAGDPAHHEKRFPQYARVGAGKERLGDRDPGGMHRLKHREFLDPAEARRDPGRRVGAQDEALPAGETSAGKFGVEAEIQLDRAAVEEFQPGYVDPACPARASEPFRQRRSPRRGHVIMTNPRQDASTYYIVIPGLDPGIHVDSRVKPGHDG